MNTRSIGARLATLAAVSLFAFNTAIVPAQPQANPVADNLKQQLTDAIQRGRHVSSVHARTETLDGGTLVSRLDVFPSYRDQTYDAITTPGGSEDFFVNGKTYTRDSADGYWYTASYGQEAFQY